MWENPDWFLFFLEKLCYNEVQANRLTSVMMNDKTNPLLSFRCLPDGLYCSHFATGKPCDESTAPL